MTSDPDQVPGDAQWSAALPRMSPARAFATVFSAVFLFILLGSAVLTFLLPETYTSVARVAAPELKAFQSPELLKEVSKNLSLPETLAARYGESKPLEAQRVEDFLRRSVQVRKLPSTGLVEVRVQSRSRAEAANLANEIAETGARQTPPGSGEVRLVDKALPALRPSRPNKALNLALGAVVGIFLGTMAGGVGAKLAVGFDGRRLSRPGSGMSVD
jgi:capsular polysaccharide biosynthesis protein